MWTFCYENFGSCEEIRERRESIRCDIADFVEVFFSCVCDAMWLLLVLFMVPNNCYVYVWICKLCCCFWLFKFWTYYFFHVLQCVCVWRGTCLTAIWIYPFCFSFLCMLNVCMMQMLLTFSWVIKYWMLMVFLFEFAGWWLVVMAPWWYAREWGYW